jgi:hypothetical protein
VAHATNAAAGPPFLFAAYENGNTAGLAAERPAGLIRAVSDEAEVGVLENRPHQTTNHRLGAPEWRFGSGFAPGLARPNWLLPIYGRLCSNKSLVWHQ